MPKRGPIRSLDYWWKRAIETKSQLTGSVRRTKSVIYDAAEACLHILDGGPDSQALIRSVAGHEKWSFNDWIDDFFAPLGQINFDYRGLIQRIRSGLTKRQWLAEGRRVDLTPKEKVQAVLDKPEPAVVEPDPMLAPERQLIIVRDNCRDLRREVRDLRMTVRMLENENRELKQENAKLRRTIQRAMKACEQANPEMGFHAERGQRTTDH